MIGAPSWWEPTYKSVYVRYLCASARASASAVLLAPKAGTAAPASNLGARVNCAMTLERQLRLHCSRY